MGTVRALQCSWLDPSTLTGCAGHRTRRLEGQASKPRPRCKDPASTPSSIGCLTCPTEHSGVTVNIPGYTAFPARSSGWACPGWADEPLPAQGGLTCGPLAALPAHQWDKRLLFSNTLPRQRPQRRFLLRKPQAS